MSKLNIKLLGPCLLAIAIDAMGFGLVYPIMAAIFSDPQSGIIGADTSPQLRNFYLGLGYGVYPFCMFFGSSLMGELSDGYGRRKILLLCVFGLALSYFLMAVGALLPSIALLLIGRGLSGLMAGCQGIAQAAITDMSTPETKAYNMSIMSIAFSAGVIVGPVLGGVTSDRTIAPFFNYGTPFLLVAALSVVCGLWTFCSYRNAVAPTGNTRVDLLMPLRIIYQAGTHRRIAFLSIVFFLMQVGYGLYLQTIMLVLQTKFHYTSSQLGLFSGLIGMSFVFGLMVIVRLMLKIWSVVDIAKTGLLIAGIGQVLSALFPHENTLWVLGMVVGCFDMVAYTTMYTAYSDAVTEDRQGWALGVAGSVMAIAWVVTGFLTNLLPVLGELGLLMVGGLSFVLSFVMMLAYGRKWSVPIVSVGSRAYD
ncbi:MFS transporter [Burkholderia ambifaria]|uniref:Major facilitator superfamily MFS_1 n=1 Tax=Burkholderia ambifaria IOP40-10 TaxID=396596 RepID=B1FH71_9BURK|nr:MFS transporter [Burkholderia ambifaria]EDT03107.1 major facilitator superfamily MFS_1 [Burkholderia ambifaria IOP40-10]